MAASPSDGLSRLRGVFHCHGISKYLDGDDMIRLLQCGSRQLNKCILNQEAVALHFTTWHTRFTNMFRLFRFLAEYFSHVRVLEMDFSHGHNPAYLTHAIGNKDDAHTGTLLQQAFEHISFPNLFRLTVHEMENKLVTIYVARFFNAILQHTTITTTVMFPALQTLHIYCAQRSLDSYNECVSAFVHHTPSSVTRLELRLVSDHLTMSEVREEFPIVEIRRDKPKLSLESLTLILNDNLHWDALVSAYDLNNLVNLNLQLYANVEFNCSVLPRSLQHLAIRVLVDSNDGWRRLGLINHTNTVADKSIVHLRNLPPQLETMNVTGVHEIIMHHALPTTLRVFYMSQSAIVFDYADNLNIPSIPRGLNAMAPNRIKNSNGALVCMSEHLLGDLLRHQNHDYVESILKRLPPHLPIFVNSVEIADRLCAFVHLRELAMLTMTSIAYRIETVYQYAIEKDKDMDATKRQALEALSTRALQLNPIFSRFAFSLTPPSKPHIFNAQNMHEPETRALLAQIDLLDIGASSSTFRVRGKTKRKPFILQDITVFEFISACVQLEYLDISINDGSNVDVLSVCLPHTLQTLTIFCNQKITTETLVDVKRMHPDMRLRYLKLKGFMVDIPTFTNLVHNVKSIPSHHQLVLSATVICHSESTVLSIDDIIVHCHSIDVDTLFSMTTATQ